MHARMSYGVQEIHLENLDLVACSDEVRRNRHLLRLLSLLDEAEVKNDLEVIYAVVLSFLESVMAEDSAES